MEKRKSIAVLLIGSSLSVAGFLSAGPVRAEAPHQSDLRELFANPPDSTRLQMWYHWVSDCVTREGLVRDFKAFGDLGVGMVHVISPNMADLPATAKTMSPEWLDLFAFAIGEAKGNGVKLSLHNCPGWSSSGGPWITPENSMKIVVASETDVDTADGARTVKLAQPLTIRGFYRDIAVYAFPLESPVFKGVEKPIVVPIKAKGAEFAVPMESPVAVSPSRLVMTFKETSFHADGVVEASVGETDWTAIGEFKFRFFKTPATPKVVNLKNVPTNARRFRVRFRHAPPFPWVPARDITLLRAEFNDLPLIGGIEDFNSATSKYGYHPELAAERRGLDPDRIANLTPSLEPDGTLDLSSLIPRPSSRTSRYRILRIGCTCKGVGPAPATTGGLECDKLDRKGIDAHWAGMPARILALPGAKETVRAMYIDSYEVGGQNWSECLPEEFHARRGAAIGKNLLTVCGYAVGGGEAAAKFLWDFQRTIGELYCENYYDRYAELCREAGIVSVAQTYGGPFDSVRAAKNIAEPQGEYWMGGNEYRTSARRMASVCHLYGKPFASAESFTSEQAEGRWLASPHAFRVVGDHSGWLEGVNRIVCHSYCHQPFTNVVPGISLGRHGSHFNVNSTWWRDGVHWHEYVRRGQALLQFGRPRAEVLVLGESSQAKLLDAGYNCDFCGEYEIGSLKTRGKGLGMPGQPDYEILVVEPQMVRRLSDASRAKLKALESAGVRVFTGDAFSAVRQAKLRAPFEEPTGSLRAIRREGHAGETVWFVANMRKKPFRGKAVFRAAPGTRPEFFDAKTGKIRAAEFAAEGADRFAVPLELPPEGSAFVVFTSDAGTFASEGRGADVSTDISDGWTITSFEGRNAPAAPLALARLSDWGKSDDPKLRFFAGRAVYERTVDGVAGRVTLDLGDVREIANVYVDGRFVDCLWEKPYRTTFEHPAGSLLRLRIEIVNLLPNRLIGDAVAIRDGAKEPRSKEGSWPKWVEENRPDSGTGIFSWSNFRAGWTADDAPLPSGLLGPVRLHVSVAPRDAVLSE